ncbi:MAG: hypothetical protein OEW08_12265, partial [Gammaproteobacteria bacterium]|nr:hypothetical protein [Gammaproteobacteria bacterium]
RQDWVGYKQGYKDKSAAIAAVRILELDPMFPPWKAYYDQMRKPGEQWMMGEAFFGHNKPCTWHTNQLVRLNIPN